MCPAPQFDDDFLSRPRFYCEPPLVPESPTWVFQATKYINANLTPEAREYVEAAAMVKACKKHVSALEALLAE